MKTPDEIAFDDYRASWLEGVTKGNPSTIELGRRFALKLITQWMEDSIETDNFIYCDGSRDGGIDLALLDTGPEEAADESGVSCSIPDDHIDPRRTALFMARSILRGYRDGGLAC